MTGRCIFSPARAALLSRLLPPVPSAPCLRLPLRACPRPPAPSGSAQVGAWGLGVLGDREARAGLRGAAAPSWVRTQQLREGAWVSQVSRKVKGRVAEPPEELKGGTGLCRKRLGSSGPPGLLGLGSAPTSPGVSGAVRGCSTPPRQGGPACRPRHRRHRGDRGPSPRGRQPSRCGKGSSASQKPPLPPSAPPVCAETEMILKCPPRPAERGCPWGSRSFPVCEGRTSAGAGALWGSARVTWVSPAVEGAAPERRSPNPLPARRRGPPRAGEEPGVGLSEPG